MLGVGHRIADYVLEEDLENSTSLLIDQAADSLYSTTPSQTSDSRLRDSLDVISQNLPVTLGASFAQPLASLTTARHSLVGVLEKLKQRPVREDEELIAGVWSSVL